MEHTYLRYECADSFGSVVSTGSSRAPVSNALLKHTAAHHHESLPPLLWSTTQSSVTAYHCKTSQPLFKFAHRDPDSVSVGSGRALNGSECVCLDTIVELQQNIEEDDSTSTAVRVATGWVDGAVRVFDLSRKEWQRQQPLGFAHSLIHRGDHEDDDDEDDDQVGNNNVGGGGRENEDFVRREPLLLNGHSSPVRAVRFESAQSSTSSSSSTRRRLASGGSDGTVVVWDVIEEVGLFRLVGHNRGVGGRTNASNQGGGGGGITDLAFVALAAPSIGTNDDQRSLDGLVSACADGLVKVWDLALQCCLQTIVNHPGPVMGMDCRNVRAPTTNPAESDPLEQRERWRLVTGSVDGLVRVWAVQAPKKASRAQRRILPGLEDDTAVDTIVVPEDHQEKAEEDHDADTCFRFMGTVSPPPNAATAHHHQKIASVQWHRHKYLGVLRADSKFVDVYRVHNTKEAAKRRQRRLRRRKEKANKKKPHESAADDPATKTKKRGLLDDPESSESDGEGDGNNAEGKVKDAPVDPDRIKASDELEYLTTVIASHKVRSFVFAPASSTAGTGSSSSSNKSSATSVSSRPLVQVVCALGTNAIESYNVVRTREYVPPCLVVQIRLPSPMSHPIYHFLSS
jgi:WD40 repeat protein